MEPYTPKAKICPVKKKGNYVKFFTGEKANLGPLTHVKQHFSVTHTFRKILDFILQFKSVSTKLSVNPKEKQKPFTVTGTPDLARLKILLAVILVVVVHRWVSGWPPCSTSWNTSLATSFPATLTPSWCQRTPRHWKQHSSSCPGGWRWFELLHFLTTSY